MKHLVWLIPALAFAGMVWLDRQAHQEHGYTESDREALSNLMDEPQPVILRLNDQQRDSVKLISLLDSRGTKPTPSIMAEQERRAKMDLGKLPSPKVSHNFD